MNAQTPAPAPTPTTLNPNAPLYMPRPPGVTALPPPHPPPQYFLCSSPSSAALFHQQPSRSFNYHVPFYSQPFSSSPYNIQAQNPIITTYLPLLPPLPPTASAMEPPQLAASRCLTPAIATSVQSEGVPRAAAARKRYSEPANTGRGGAWQRGGRVGRGFQHGGSWRRGGGGRGFFGRENSSNNFERRKQLIGKGSFQEGSCNPKNTSKNFRRNRKFEKRNVQEEENRHQVLPLKRDEVKTTVMIKNIPYDYTRKVLLRRLDEFCILENHKATNESTSEESEAPIVTAYDFFYYPIDFRSKKGRGFAFVNFTHPRTIWKLFDAFHHKKWDSVEWAKWPKTIEIVSAKIQGKEALKKHFAESTFECESDEFLPVSFSPPRNGSIDRSVKLITIGKRGGVYPFLFSVVSQFLLPSITCSVFSIFEDALLVVQGVSGIYPVIIYGMRLLAEAPHSILVFPISDSASISRISLPQGPVPRRQDLQNSVSHKLGLKQNQENGLGFDGEDGVGIEVVEAEAKYSEVGGELGFGAVRKHVFLKWVLRWWRERMVERRWWEVESGSRSFTSPSISRFGFNFGADGVVPAKFAGKRECATDPLHSSKYKVWNSPVYLSSYL
ncbi:unnamed protein product [Fraxinus pennsylvanica]|uniref:Mei2-like C-terminal RNA recognition motif domain-containing protein n=1 Tax=Fraxinus pennsylvanica TaxID=56036 RepID=A0AAD2ADV6_9LAMI|nr:unnamed protein product [Fraxinus pennsylvanica]